MITDLAWDAEAGDFVLDVGGNLKLAKNLSVVRQDLMARLVSPPGSHWAYPTEGMDSREYINALSDDLTRLEFRQEVEIEVQRDARVFEASATVTQLSQRQARVSVTATLTDAAIVSLDLLLGTTS